MRPIWIGLTFLAMGCPSQEMQKLEESKLQLARLAVQKLADEAGPTWMMTHPGTECPESIGALAEAVGMDRASTVDPWGAPYELSCGADRPAGMRGSLGVRSLGPDRKRGTADDIASWDAKPAAARRP